MVCLQNREHGTLAPLVGRKRKSKMAKNVRTAKASKGARSSIPATKNKTAAPAKQLERETNPLKKFLLMLGPGFITGASDDDPSGIGTYAQAGAQFGFAPLWLALFTFPLMTAVQFISGKIGMVSGMGLSGVLRRHYPVWVLYPAVTGLLIANTINAGADIGAVAAAINMLVPKFPILALIVPVTVVILIVQIWGSYQLISKTFKWLALALLAYIASSLLSKPDLGEVVRGTFIPTIRFDGGFVTMLVAVLGTTISPYLWFWQANQNVEEEISLGRTTLKARKGATEKELNYSALDTGIGMFFSNMVMYFIILATAATLHSSGQTNIESATDAARALEPLAGKASSVLLAVGLIGAGFLAIPVLTGSGAYAVAEAFGWKQGLDEKPKRAKAFYAVITASTLVGMLINFTGINPIAALFWTAVINGVLAAPILVLIMLVSNNKTVMRNRVNRRGINVLGWLTTGIMAVATVLMFVFWNS
jgi:NRAMP (natural resistance-associated macrophage protein)-like metal ion transporter